MDKSPPLGRLGQARKTGMCMCMFVLYNSGLSLPLSVTLQPSECGPCYVFLASQEASYMTGEVLHPNGGMWMSS